jgi:RNA polymerase sigma-70 factor (ECF subfamily)
MGGTRSVWPPTAEAHRTVGPRRDQTAMPDARAVHLYRAATLARTTPPHRGAEAPVSLRLGLGGSDRDPAPGAARTTVERPPIAPDLAERLQTRDPEALTELYRATGRRAFGLAFRIVGDAAAAEDVVQDAFLAIWDQAERIDPARGRVDSLLMTIVHRRATDHVRRRSRRREIERRSPDALADPVDEHASELLDAVASAPDHARVRECLAALPPEQHEAVQLAYFAGMTHREIAETTGLPLGTVKSRLRLAMQRLRELFGIPDEGRRS